MLSEGRRQVLEHYTKCETVLLEPKKSRSAVVSALLDEVQLERDARLIDPYVCIDTNGLSYALYIGEQPLAPLGVCIRRHFANFSDFLWIERTERSSAKRELWSAVLVQDGLAIEEALHVPKADLRSLLGEIYAPINVLTIHKSLLESWLPRSMGQGGQPLWVETSVSPLGSAGNLAALANIEDALRHAGLKLKSGLIRAVRGVVATLILATTASAIYFYSSGQPLPWASSTNSSDLQQSAGKSLDVLNLEQQLISSWHAREILSRPATSAYLKKAYEMLLEGWSIGLDVRHLTIADDGTIELFFTNSVSDSHTHLIAAWCKLRNLEPHINAGSSNNSIIGNSLVTYESLGETARPISEEELRAAAHYLGAVPLRQDASSVGRKSQTRRSAARSKTRDRFTPRDIELAEIAEKPEGANPAHTLTMSVPSFGNPEVLLHLAEDESLRFTFIKALSFEVDSKALALASAVELTVGSWKTE